MIQEEITKTYLSKISIENINNDYVQDFERLGLPNHKTNENWKHTPISLFPKNPVFKPLENKSEVMQVTPDFNQDLFHIINIYNNKIILDNLALPDGIQVTKSSNDCTNKSLEKNKLTNLTEFESDRDSVLKLTQATTHEKITFVISKTPEKQLRINFIFDTDINEDHWCSQTINFQIKQDTQISIVTTCSGKIASHSNLFNFDLAKNANLNHLNIIDTSHRYFGNSLYLLNENSQLNSFSISNSTPISRQNIEVLLNGKYAHASVNGLFETSGEDHCDIFTLVRHNRPHTTSTQLFKGIASDHSRGIYNGKVVINKDCPKCNSAQLTRNLIKNKSAKIFARPQLEVYNDDVACSHGATFGQLSEDELFYLTSRGIAKQHAEKMLQKAFYSETTDTISSGLLKELANQHIENRYDK